MWISEHISYSCSELKLFGMDFWQKTVEVIL